MAQMGPFEIIAPIEGPVARGGLLHSVEVWEPTADPGKAVMAAEAALQEARDALADVIEPDALARGRAAVDRLETVLDEAASAYAASRRWENGYTWRPAGGCGAVNTWAPCSGDLKRVDPTAPLVEGIPFTAYAGFSCSSWAMDEMERIAHAEVRLAARSGGAIASELWTGAIALAQGWPTPYLASPAAVQLTIGAQSSPLRYALGSLQDALRDCYGSEWSGTIHATPMTVSLWRSEYLIDVEQRVVNGVQQDVLVDAFGNVIIGDGGYNGSSPTGAIDPSGHTAWAYATGPVRVMVGPIYMTPDDTAEALKRDTNDITWRAERSASAAFDPCCLFGINVDLCNLCCAPIV